jgi:hypothetical protein
MAVIGANRPSWRNGINALGKRTRRAACHDLGAAQPALRCWPYDLCVQSWVSPDSCRSWLKGQAAIFRSVLSSDPTLVSGHSMRSGYVTSAVEQRGADADR